MGVLRFALALAVYVHHLWIPTTLMDGVAAVFCFFVISGFYMELVLTKKYNLQRLGPSYARQFYLARFWRLYPAYALTCAAVLVTAVTVNPAVISPALSAIHSSNLFAAIKSLAIWIISFTGILLNLPPAKDLLIPPSWTVGIECSFYVIAPYCLKLRTRILLVLTLIGLTLQFTPYGQHSPVLYGFHFFLLGAVVFRHKASIEAAASQVITPHVSLLYAIVILLVIFAIPHEIYVGPMYADSLRAHANNTLDCLIYPIVIAFLTPLLYERTKSSKIDEWIGYLSYPFYLVHQLAIDAFVGWGYRFKSEYLVVICTAWSGMMVILELRFIEPWRAKFSNPSREGKSSHSHPLKQVQRSDVNR